MVSEQTVLRGEGAQHVEAAGQRDDELSVLVSTCRQRRIDIAIGETGKLRTRTGRSDSGHDPARCRLQDDRGRITSPSSYAKSNSAQQNSFSNRGLPPMIDIDSADLTLGIVGTGAMGRGIAQIAAQAGIAVRLLDSRAGAAAQAKDELGRTFEMLAGKGRMTADAARQAGERLQVIDATENLAGCHIIIEAIVEDLGVKKQLFAALEPIVGDDCLIASNTSSLSITAIATACKHPGRVGGFHFFNPVPLMKVVEVIDGVLTEKWVGDALTKLARRMGHQPVRATDTPGFIVNHAGRGFGTEALRILQEAVAPVETIDRILREAAGFRMGPFELMDLTGVDVSHPVMESVYEQFYQEPRFRPSYLLRQ